ncbi:hypothetical protein ACHWQZ_G011361 [Mnemiopsis leidyi]
MSAVRRRTANDLLCGAITAPLLEYSVVILVHGVSCQNVPQIKQQASKISVQIARLNEELPLLKTKTIPSEKSIFEEVLVVHTETLEELELLLCTSDEVIDEFDLRLADRNPFEYYHITLAGQQSELFVTLVIKTKQIPPSPNSMLDVQVLVQYLETPIDRPREGVVIVGKDHFENAYSQISFNAHDKVQLSTPQGPSDQPQWYHTFLFYGASPQQNIGIFLFHQPFINMENAQWSLGDKIGECCLPLDDKLIQLLQDNRDGVCFTKIPLISVQSNLFIRISFKLGVSPPLTPNNIPETLLEWGKQGETALKQLDSTRPPEMNAGDVTSTETMQIPGAVRQGISQSEDSGNDKDSLVLPDHSAILQRHATPQTKQKESSLHYDENKDNSVEYMTKVIEQQAGELRKYRDAVQKMGKDILACRDYIVALKKDNTKMKSTVAKLQEPIHDVSLMNVPRDNLIKEVIRARRALREQVEENNVLSTTVTSLQQKFASFESERREINELRSAHTSQNQLLQKLQDKVKVTRVLEKTCKDQEKVIEQLEGMLQGAHMQQKRVTFQDRSAILPPPGSDNGLATPKLEPLDPGFSAPESDSLDNIPPETSLKLRVRALENQLRFSQQAHQDEMTRLAADKMDLQLQLARLRR